MPKPSQQPTSSPSSVKPGPTIDPTRETPQIRIAFEQAQKEVDDLRQRTREGIETARLNGKQIGQRPGNKLKVKKEGPAKEKIMKFSKDFNGTLADTECIKLIGISRNNIHFLI